MIVIHAVFPIKESQRKDALALADEMVEKSNEEDGVLEYRATTDVRDPNVVRFFEKYEDETAFRKHTETEHFQRFEERLPDLLGGEPGVTQFDVSEETRLEL